MATGGRDLGRPMAAVAVVLAAAVLAACAGRRPASVSLARLAADQEAYRGEQVKTQGVVRRFTDTAGSYFVIEDAEHDRVEVLPASRMARYQGRRVELTGRFGVGQTTGRFIQVERVSAGGG
ncbi:MAG TPA: hypothetical protein VE776_14375 [Actinomycetota bacterium]|nr:hypothetical protein [Actinomycetota bacterium]